MNDVYWGTADPYTATLDNYCQSPPALEASGFSSSVTYLSMNEDQGLSEKSWAEMEACGPYPEPSPYPALDIVGQSLQRAMESYPEHPEIYATPPARQAEVTNILPPITEFRGMNAYDQWSTHSNQNYNAETGTWTSEVTYGTYSPELIPDIPGLIDHST